MHFLEKCTAEKEAFNYRQKVELNRLLRKQEEETLFLQGARYGTLTSPALSDLIFFFNTYFFPLIPLFWSAFS
jgi:hypothetical protein